MPALVSRKAIENGVPDGWDAMRQRLAGLPYTDVTTPQPLVFQCGVYVSPDGILKVFRFVFYGGNVIFVFNKPPAATEPTVSEAL